MTFCPSVSTVSKLIGCGDTQILNITSFLSNSFELNALRGGGDTKTSLLFLHTPSCNCNPRDKEPP